MIFSNERKLTLSAWLRNNHRVEYEIPLKLQKFLFFYEVFSKVAGEKADFDHLRGYRNGPVFSNVWGDYTKERYSFELRSQDCFENFSNIIDTDIAQQCSFIVATLSEYELSALTHKMNIWKCKEKFINLGYEQVSLCESDFNSADFQLIKILGSMYPLRMVNSSEIIRLGDFYFVISKKDFRNFTEQHIDTLSIIVQEEELHNPVFIEIDEKGRLIID